MKIRNPGSPYPLEPELVHVLAGMRALRNFNARLYAQGKVLALNAYMADHGLSACVLGVSGGIDSAVVLALLCLARDQPGSPIREIVAMCIPVPGTAGATGQSGATARGIEVCTGLGIEPRVVDLGLLHTGTSQVVEQAMGVEGDAWAAGQLVSVLRTPVLYYATSLLAQRGLAPILLGTTNRDEGGYLGFFGKASDAMVDVQPISDLHKSEVRALAQHLGVPQSVMDATPQGDLFDGRVDEEVFGAPYDFVELYTGWLNIGDEERLALVDALPASARCQFDRLAHNIEATHAYNAHKYLARSQAIHLDILDARVQGGWDNTPPAQAMRPGGGPVNLASLPARVETIFKGPDSVSPHYGRVDAMGPDGMVVDGLMSPEECRAVLDWAGTSTWVPTGDNGRAGEFEQGAQPSSWRLSMLSTALAGRLWSRLQPGLGCLRLDGPDANLDGAERDPVWYPVGVNPLLRLIRYEGGGNLVAHYDAPWDQDSQTRTLLSLVVYLNEACQGMGGQTRILSDPQAGLRPRHRDLSDKPGGMDFAPLVVIEPRQGLGALWDHRVLHEGATTAVGSSKTILRTDVLYRRGLWWRE